jgi:hypothetical protein
MKKSKTFDYYGHTVVVDVEMNKVNEKSAKDYPHYHDTLPGHFIHVRIGEEFDYPITVSDARFEKELDKAEKSAKDYVDEKIRGNAIAKQPIAEKHFDILTEKGFS